MAGTWFIASLESSLGLCNMAVGTYWGLNKLLNEIVCLLLGSALLLVVLNLPLSQDCVS